jgi:Fe-S cluster biosynthesis and repair protein YggX
MKEEFAKSLKRAKKEKSRQEKKVVELESAPGFDPDDDSDRALWAAYKHHKRVRRESKLEMFNLVDRQRLEEELGYRLVQHSEHHFSFTLQDKRVDYWPSGSRWRWKNRTYYGDAPALIGFVRKRKNQPKGS